MARDLHDTLEQQLSGIALQLDGLSDAIAANPPAATRSLSLARRMLRFTRLEARRSVWDLRSRSLEKEGLSGALRMLAETSTGSAGPAVQLNVSGGDHPLPPSVEFHLLRIAQEALANATKHAEAKRILIELERAQNVTRLVISDDGKGFNPQSPESSPGPHFGLLGMRERVAKMSGQLTLNTAPGKGCTVTVIVPAANSDSKR